MNGSDNQEENNVYESKKELVLRILDVFGALFVLNIIFVLFSLPIFTIGASVTALYSMMFKVIKDKEGNLFEGFINAFKKSFVQATACFGLVIFWIIVLWAQYMLIIMNPGILGSIYMVIMFMSAILGAFTVSFAFPVIARYDNSLMANLKNAFLLSISNIGAAIKITCLWFGSIAISIIYPVIFLYSWFLWLFIAFALIAFISAIIIMKVFSKIE